jgi:AcrR family transcriptional regulator
MKKHIKTIYTMIDKELNTEQIILQAAEAEFLEMGYAGAKMLSIARRAGLSHSMLHYYFRTKKNLFQQIFLQKVQILTQIFVGIYEQHLSFEESLRNFIKKQFDFVAKNPQLPRFALNEIITNRSNRSLLFEVLAPRMAVIFDNLGEMLRREIEAGRVRPITLTDLVMTIVVLNTSTFIALPVLEELFPAGDPQGREKILNDRLESNIQFVLNALRP